MVEKVSILYTLYGPFPGFESRVGVLEMAKHIVESGADIDRSLESGSEDAFNIIKSVNGKERSGERSFASKYCHFSQPEKYAIFDSRAESAVLWLRSRGKIHSIQNVNNYTYTQWRNAVNECTKLAKGKLMNFKQIDQALYEIGWFNLFVGANLPRTVEDVCNVAKNEGLSKC